MATIHCWLECTSQNVIRSATFQLQCPGPWVPAESWQAYSPAGTQGPGQCSWKVTDRMVFCDVHSSKQCLSVLPTKRAGKQPRAFSLQASVRAFRDTNPKPQSKTLGPRFLKTKNKQNANNSTVAILAWVASAASWLDNLIGGLAASYVNVGR